VARLTSNRRLAFGDGQPEHLILIHFWQVWCLTNNDFGANIMIMIQTHGSFYRNFAVRDRGNCKNFAKSAALAEIRTLQVFLLVIYIHVVLNTCA